MTADSEIAAGRIALFSRSLRRGETEWLLLLSHGRNHAPIWTVDGLRRLPGFHQAPSLCAARTFL
jgi:hypothetical protein